MATTGKPVTPKLSVVQGDNKGIVTGEEINEVDAVAKGKIVSASLFSREELSEIESFDDAMKLAQAQFGTVINAHEDKNLGSGFRLTTDEDKFKLIKVPLLLLDWRFNPGEHGDDFVSITCISQQENGQANKLIINDGGTGICKDLKEYTAKTGRMGGLFCRRGLRVSEYDTDAETGLPIGKMMVADFHKTGHKVGKGKTFYLDFSA